MRCTVGFLPESCCRNWAAVFRDCMWTQGNEGLGFPPAQDMYKVHALWRVSSNDHMNIGERLILETSPGKSPWTSLTEQGASLEGAAFLHLLSPHLVERTGFLLSSLLESHLQESRNVFALHFIFLLTFDSLLFLVFLPMKDKYFFCWVKSNKSNE